MLFGSEREAAQEWVGSFNQIPMSVIEKMFNADEDSFWEVTLPAKYDRVYIYNVRKEGEILSFEDDEYTIKTDDGETVKLTSGEFEVNRDGMFPMWGTMFAFKDEIDNDWLRGEFETDGLRKMSDCGIRVYENEDYGYVFGIDGAGYDFYEEHWIPLYRARGLKWHRDSVDLSYEGVHFDEDLGATVKSNFCGIPATVKIPAADITLLHHLREDAFNEEDVANELDYNEEEKLLTEEQIKYLREHIDEVVSDYSDIKSNDEAWYEYLNTAIRQVLSKAGL